MRTDLGLGHSRLKPPVVVGQGIVYPRIKGRLHPLLGAKEEQRKEYRTFLRPPTVVTPAAAFIAAPITTTLAPSSRAGRRTMAGIRPPRFVGAGIVFREVQVSLAYSRRGVPKSRLLPPAVVAVPRTFSGPQVTLVQQPLQARFSRCFTGATSERRVVRTNLITNGGFEIDTAGWITVFSTLGTGQPGLFGVNFGNLTTFNFSANEGMYCEFFADGSPVTVSAYLLNGGAPQFVRLTVTDSGGGNAQQGPSIVPDGTWTRFSFTTTALATGKWRFYIETVSQTAVTIFVDGAQVERGSIATPYIETHGATASSTRSDIFGYERCIGPRLPRVLEQFFELNRPQTTLAYSRRGTPKSRLLPPAVVTIPTPFVAAPVTVVLAPSSRGVAKPVLFPPAVVGDGVVFPPLYGALTPLTYATRPRPKSVLRPPAVVTTVVTETFRGPLVHLAPSRRGRTIAGIGSPVFVGGAITFRPVQTHLAYSRRGAPKSRLSPPTTVTDTRVYGGPTVNLAYSRRGVTKSALHPPTVIDLSPQVYYLAVTLAKIRPPATHSRLSPSAVTEALPRAEREIRVTLAYSVRGKPKSALLQPTVIDLRPQVYYLSVSLAYSRRGVAKPNLAPPTVVDTRVYGGPQTTLAYSRRGQPKSVLREPVVIDVRPQTVYLSVSLTYSRRGVAKSELRPPTVVSRDTFAGPTVNLTYSTRPKALYGLAAPAVVFIPEPVLYPVQVTLAYQSRGEPKSFLRRPQVTGAVVYYGPQINLTYSRRGAPKSALREPVVIDLSSQAKYLAVHLTYSRRGTPKSRLFPPIIPPLAPPVQVTLARIRPQPVTTVLSPPAVTVAPPQTVYLSINLAYSVRGKTKSALHPPVVIDLSPQTFYLSVTLARIKPPPTHTRLSPSTVTEALPKAERELRVTLTYSRRGAPYSQLLPPTVVGAGVFFDGVVGESFPLFPEPLRRQPKSHLFPPTVVDAPRVFFGPTITLAPQKFGVPKSRLNPPAVVGAPFIAAPVTVILSYSLRGQAKPFLSPPEVVGQIVFFGPTVTLAPQKRGLPKPFLAPPTVVTPPFFASPVSVTLTYSRRGAPKSFLSEPILEPPRFFGPVVSLAEPRRLKAKYGLAPPAVIGPGIYFRGIQVHLVRITHPPVEYQLFPPAVVSTFHPPQGDVCGFDVAASFVTGVTEAESTICGSDEADGDVCGTDQQST